MALVYQSEECPAVGRLKASSRIAICGEVSSGKTSVLQALLREDRLPDFFGIQDRPVIRFITGADRNEVRVESRDGAVETFAEVGDFKPVSGLAEIRIMSEAASPFGPCELVEMPPLRDGFVTDEEIDRISNCDMMIWVTIGSQAWRLSEKTIIEDLGNSRPSESILVVSRGDKLRSDADRAKLMGRLDNETAEFFGTRLLMTAAPKLLKAAVADDRAWSGTGAPALAAALVETSERREPYSETVPEAPTDADASTKTDNIVSFASRRPDEADERLPVEEAQPVEPDMLPSAPVSTIEVDKSPLDRFVSTLHGAIAIGAVRRDDGNALRALYGSDSDVSALSEFAVRSAGAVDTVEEFCAFGAGSHLGHVAMQRRRVLYRIADAEILFLACDSRQMSAGIAHNVFSRLCKMYDAEA